MGGNSRRDMDPNYVQPSGYWLNNKRPGWRVGRGPLSATNDLRRAVKLADDPATVDDAICCLNRVLEVSYQHGRDQATIPQALFLRSILYTKGSESRQSDPSAAFADLSTAISMEPDYCAAWLNRAGILFDRGQWEEALSDISRAIQAFHAPQSRWPRSRDSVKAPALHANKGMILDSLERHHEAYHEFMQAVELDPLDSTCPGAAGSSYFRAAEILLKYGSPMDGGVTPDEARHVAMGLLIKATTLNPAHFEACALRGKEHLHDQSLGEAITMYKQCLRFCTNPAIAESAQHNLAAAKRQFHDALMAGN